MTSDERHQRYVNALEDQRHLLSTAVTGMSNGDLRQALHIAVSIRLLIHETARNKPLLKCLRPDFLALPISGMALATSSTPLRIPTTIQVTTSEPHLRLITEIGGTRDERLALGEWWNGPFVVLPEAGQFSRKDIVVGLADKEAAHVDANISAKFKLLIDCKQFQAQINDLIIPSINLSRVIVGRAGVELITYLDEHFAHSDG